MSESTMPLYFCCDERRRDTVRGSALNGIDYLEVVDHDAPDRCRSAAFPPRPFRERHRGQLARRD